MTVQRLFPAALAFLLGAALFASGGPEDDLRDQLGELREQAARLEAQARSRDAARDVPPVNDRGMVFELFPAEDLTLPVLQAVPPTPRGWRHNAAPLFGGQAEEAPQPFGTIEELSELVRVSFGEAWNRGQLMPLGATLIGHHEPRLLAKVRGFLDGLRLKARRTVGLETRLVEVPAAQGPAWAARLGTTAADEDAVNDARAVFAGRILALSGQRVVLWHGGQAALLGDADVEVAQEASVPDPNVIVELLGGILDVRATAAEGRDRILVQLGFDHRRLAGEVREQVTRDSGTLQLPEVDAAGISADLDVPGGRWVVAGEARAGTGLRRFLLVRATVIRKETVR